MLNARVDAAQTSIKDAHFVTKPGMNHELPSAVCRHLDPLATSREPSSRPGCQHCALPVTNTSKDHLRSDPDAWVTEIGSICKCKRVALAKLHSSTAPQLVLSFAPPKKHSEAYKKYYVGTEAPKHRHFGPSAIG